MFGCRKKSTKERIVSISTAWINRGDELRELAAADELICPLCQFSLNYRRGSVNKPHFSHRPAPRDSDEKCPLSKERRSKKETEAMLLLFQTLEAKYPGNIDADVHFEDDNSTIDILITKDGKPVHAYWIMSKLRKLETIEKTTQPATSRSIPCHVIYTTETHCSQGETLKLSNSQAQQIQFTKAFDIDEDPNEEDGHLYFLDVESSSMLIYRGLYQRRHQLSTYGYWACRESNLTDIALHETGEILTKEDIGSYPAKLSLSKSKQKHTPTSHKKKCQRAVIQRPAKPVHVSLTCKYCLKPKSRSECSIELPQQSCVCHACLTLHNQQQKDQEYDW